MKLEKKMPPPPQEPCEGGAETLEVPKGWKISREDGPASHLIRTRRDSQRLK